MEKIILTSDQAADMRVALLLAIETATNSATNAEGIQELESNVAYWRKRAQRYRDIERILRNGYRIEVSPISNATF